MNKIAGFFQEFRFLSNFYPSEITLDGVTYPTVEHAYQALKATSEEEHEFVRTQPTPKKAKWAGRKVQIRPYWDEVRLDVMRTLLELKFSDPDLRLALVLTYPNELEETNYWQDVFWGVCNGIGENHLGKLLMEIREKIIDSR